MRILVADDEAGIRRGIQLCLKNEGHDIVSVSDGKEALTRLNSENFDLVLSDVKMPNITGLELLAALKQEKNPVPIIIMTAYANVKDAVHALKIGAEDYLTKPLNLDELVAKVAKIQERAAVKKENEELRHKLKTICSPDMVGMSKSFREMLHLVQRVAQDGTVPVMIYGESGTGKELAAQKIHDLGPRAQEKFVAINCAAFNDELLESELFGHKKGAFTGAMLDKQGIFLAADRGTLFLDEVNEMSPRMQAKLLRTLQEGTIQPVGSTETVKVDVRIIGASNVDLMRAVQDGTFREDLFYRLNVVEIRMPPLRERREDISLLFQHFVGQYSESELLLSPEVHHFFQSYHWPGNVRELLNLVRLLLAVHHDSVVTMDHLPRTMVSSGSLSKASPGFVNDYKTAYETTVSRFEKDFFSFHLQKNDSNISKTARSVGLSRVALHQKIKKYEIKL